MGTKELLSLKGGKHVHGSKGPGGASTCCQFSLQQMEARLPHPKQIFILDLGEAKRFWLFISLRYWKMRTFVKLGK